MDFKLYYKGFEVDLVDAYGLGDQIDAAFVDLDRMGDQYSAALTVEVVAVGGRRLFPIDASHGALANGSAPVVFVSTGTVQSWDLDIEFDIKAVPLGQDLEQQWLLRRSLEMLSMAMGGARLTGRSGSWVVRAEHLSRWRIVFAIWILKMRHVDGLLKKDPYGGREVNS